MYILIINLILNISRCAQLQYVNRINAAPSPDSNYIAILDIETIYL